MSDEENNPSKPSPEIEAVPLNKDTIRVNLSKDSGSEGGASAPTPPAPPKVQAPAAPAPTIPIGGGAPKPAAPAPTIRLNTPSKPIVAGGTTKPAVPSPTKPIGSTPKPAAPGLSQPMPKATVPMGTAKLPSLPGSDNLATQKRPEASFGTDEDTTVQLVEENNVVPLVLSVILLLVCCASAFIAFSTNTKTDGTSFLDEEKQAEFIRELK